MRRCEVFFVLSAILCLVESDRSVLLQVISIVFAKHRDA